MCRAVQVGRSERTQQAETVFIVLLDDLHADDEVKGAPKELYARHIYRFRRNETYGLKVDLWLLRRLRMYVLKCRRKSKYAWQVPVACE